MLITAFIEFCLMRFSFEFTLMNHSGKCYVWNRICHWVKHTMQYEIAIWSVLTELVSAIKIALLLSNAILFHIKYSTLGSLLLCSVRFWRPPRPHHSLPSHECMCGVRSTDVHATQSISRYIIEHELPPTTSFPLVVFYLNYTGIANYIRVAELVGNANIYGMRNGSS